MDGVVLLMGSGRIGFPITEPVVTKEAGDAAVMEERISVQWVDSPRIAVTAFGTVLFSDAQGRHHVVHNADVEIDRIEYSLLDIDTPNADGTPNCHHCSDDPTAVAGWMPPVCPNCGLRGRA